MTSPSSHKSSRDVSARSVPRGACPALPGAIPAGRLLPPILAVFALLAPAAHAGNAEFDAAIGKLGYGRCHMDSCDFFTIDTAVPIASTKEGTLFAISDRVWSAGYKAHGDNDLHEYDRPPVSVGKQSSEISMVFCSKTKPVVFNYYDDKWNSVDLRPGDENSVFGATESAYQFYFAACHHFITHDPVSKNMALKLGYPFANEPAKIDAVPSEENRQPLDMVK
ncbi:MAG TPA: hypothetical protein VL996_01095 [Methylocella sp.]|nr:hypothetical protein [Methylocella sp.]